MHVARLHLCCARRAYQRAWHHRVQRVACSLRERMDRYMRMAPAVTRQPLNPTMVSMRTTSSSSKGNTYVYVYVYVYIYIYVCTHTHIHIHMHAYVHTYMNTCIHTLIGNKLELQGYLHPIARSPARPHTLFVTHSRTHTRTRALAHTVVSACQRFCLSLTSLSLSLSLSVSLCVCLSLLLLLRLLLLLIHESLSLWLSFASLALFLPPLHPLLCLCMQLLFGAGDADALNISSSIRTNLAKHSAQHFQKLFAAFQPQMIRESLTCRTSR